MLTLCKTKGPFAAFIRLQLPLCIVCRSPGSRGRSPGSWCTPASCCWLWFCRSWACVLCSTSTEASISQTCTPCTAGWASAPWSRLHFRYIYTDPHFWKFSRCLNLKHRAVLFGQWLLGLAGFLLPCSPWWLRVILKPFHVWLGKAVLILSLASCVSGLNEKLVLAL